MRWQVCTWNSATFEFRRFWSDATSKLSLWEEMPARSRAESLSVCREECPRRPPHAENGSAHPLLLVRPPQASYPFASALSATAQRWKAQCHGDNGAPLLCISSNRLPHRLSESGGKEQSGIRRGSAGKQQPVAPAAVSRPPAAAPVLGWLVPPRGSAASRFCRRVAVAARSAVRPGHWCRFHLGAFPALPLGMPLCFFPPLSLSLCGNRLLEIHSSGAPLSP